MKIEDVIRYCDRPAEFIAEQLQTPVPPYGHPFVLRPEQRDWIDQIHALKKGRLDFNENRQVGTSMTLAAYVTWRLNFRHDQTIGYFGWKSDNAYDFIDRVRDFDTPLESEYLSDPIVSQKGKYKLKNYSAIRGYSSLMHSPGQGMAYSLCILDNVTWSDDLRRMVDILGQYNSVVVVTTT